MSLAAEIAGALDREGFALVRVAGAKRNPPPMSQTKYADARYHNPGGSLAVHAAGEVLKDVLCLLDLEGSRDSRARVGRGAMLCPSCFDRIH